MTTSGVITFEPSRVLVVDDDPILREFATAELTSEWVQVDVSENGREGLNRLRNCDIDIAMVDLEMPVMDGFELIAAVRSDEQLQHLPIVVATSRDDTAAIDRAFAAGATSFVLKPLNWRVVAYQLSYVLRSSREEKRIRSRARTLRDSLRAQDEIVRAYDKGVQFLVKTLLEHDPDLATFDARLCQAPSPLETVWKELERLRRWRSYGAH